ncbi:MAG TPA: MATE family efflux transporter [Oribacterium sp.]|nr:MATE family efflux transporter [Oribacterium sp.]HCS67245.1 MATE family efflux transporter [Oribacterium sp.]
MAKKKTTTRDMTTGNSAKEIMLFALPLMFGNIFQMLYNTVDSIVVGNYVSTQALAAVGATTMIVNMAVFFFNGFSVGAGVIIGRYFGAKNMDRLHDSIETTMAATFVFCVLFTIVGMLAVPMMLNFMSTPEDVMADASTYLRTYFAGIAGLLIYNMGSGILRAVGDTRRPLFFLVLTSLLNIGLDLLFVLGFHLGIFGVALATILSQFISAILTLILLLKTNDIYKLTLHDCRIDPAMLGQIFAVGLPAGIQSIITAFSNVFVQAYINNFGSACMAGWASYNKLDQFIMLFIQSMAMAATTFVSQNIGAQKLKRANEGTVLSVVMTLLLNGTLAVLLWAFAPIAVGLFTPDPEVITFGVLFIRQNVFFLLFNSVNHVLAGALRGRGDSTGPMIIMLLSFVAVRQVYLFIMTCFIANTPATVGFGYPVGWTTCCILETLYFFIRWSKKTELA